MIAQTRVALMIASATAVELQAICPGTATSLMIVDVDVVMPVAVAVAVAGLATGVETLTTLLASVPTVGTKAMCVVTTVITLATSPKTALAQLRPLLEGPSCPAVRMQDPAILILRIMVANMPVLQVRE